MKAVLLEIPEPLLGWLNERARLGHDRIDEMWNGVLHMVPPPGGEHQRRGSRLIEILGPLARERGLVATYETGVFRPGQADDYRVPDVAVWSSTNMSKRGVEGRAELVIETRSANDESWEKLPFYAEMGIPEVLIIDGDVASVLRLTATGAAYTPVEADPGGWVALAAVALELRTDPAGGLLVRSSTETAVV